MGDAPRTLQGIPEGPRGPGRGADADTVPAPTPPVEPPPEPTIPSEDPAGARPSAKQLAMFPVAPAGAQPAHERYRLGAELGRGGMGRVVEAFDTQLGRTVALKEVLPRGGASVAKRFVREVQLTARLEHPSIVPLYDSGTTVDGRPFYVMRRVSGRPLDELVKRARTPDERLTLLPAVLAAIDAVAHAHKRGVIHRDLKPANILVGELGETVVIDWGLAKVIGEEDTGAIGEPTRSPTAADSLQTQIGSVFGTPGFMAPEQARGEELDPRGDVYALGATLYQVLAGRPPHAGNSATEVIDRTRKHEMKALGEIAPGTPPELIAIVDKALAFDKGGRYADAGALGEDVRRFLAGQLVAAHRYTPAQRVKRFARRHRSTLAVAAMALVAVAVLAWISVHRIVRERDLANEAREAEAREAAARGKALAEAQQRADQLTIQQARMFLDKNPTLSAAMLKQLPETSPRVPDARALAQAASARGIAWAMQAPDELTVVAELSADSQYVLQVTRDTVARSGALRVWDVERHRLVLTRPYDIMTRALWVGSNILVTHEGAAPELLDPVAGSIQTLAVPAMSDPVATARGDRVLFLLPDKSAAVLDVPGRTVTPIWQGHRPTALAIAADGSWYALGDKAGAVALSPSGAELAKRAGEVIHIEASRFDEFAILERTGAVSMCKLNLSPTGEAAPAWSAFPMAKIAPNIVMNIAFRGHRLVVFASPNQVLAWPGGAALYEELRLEQFTHRLVEAGDNLVLAASTNGEIQYAGPSARGALKLPAVMPNLKLLARGGSSRVIVIARGLIVGYDLADVTPKRIDARVGTLATFATDDTLLLWGNASEEWVWYDIPTGKRVGFHYDLHGLPRVVDVDPVEGRILVSERTGADVRLVVLRKGTRETLPVATSPMDWGRLMPGDSVAYALGDGRVFLRRGTEPPREIAKLEGIAEAAVPIGRSGFTAISDAGELVRGDTATGQLKRTRIRVGTTSVLAADKRGRTLISEDNRLFVWDTDLVEVAHFDKPIVELLGLEDTALVALSSHEVARVSLTPGSQPVRVLPPSQQVPVASGDGKLVLGVSTTGALGVVEVPQGIAWEMPLLYPMTMQVAISPTARRVVQGGLDELVLWRLPLATGDLRGWLEERTEGTTDGEHGIEWPWQVTHAATVPSR